MRKIYVDNTLHRIRALDINNTGIEELKEYEVPDDFLGDLCDTAKLCYCYERGIDEDGSGYESVYPFVDSAIIDAIQREHDLMEASVAAVETPPAVLQAVRFAAVTFSDQQALQVMELYPLWSELPDGTELTTGSEAVKGTEITRVRGDDGKLYRVETTHRKQSDWAPGQATAALFTVIDAEHAGTLEDPIPAAANMEYIKGKYYIEDGQVYLMNRAGMEDGEGVVLQYLPSQLVGHYFEIVEV